MSREGAYRYLIAYDIADDRRRAKLASRLKAYGERIQFSVFIVDVKPARIVRLRALLLKILEPTEDSVAICELGPLSRAIALRMEFLGVRPDLMSSRGFIV